MSDLDLDLLVAAAEAVERLGHLGVVRCEVGCAVVGEHRNLVLGEQLLAHEIEQRVHALRGFDEPAPPEHDQEDPVVLGRERGALRRLAQGGLRAGLRRLGRQRVLGEVADFLWDAVLQDDEVLDIQAGDRFPVRVHDSDIDRDQRDPAAKDRLVGPLLRQRDGRADNDQKDDDGGTSRLEHGGAFQRGQALRGL